MGPSREPLHRLFEFCMVLAICLCEPWTLRYSIWTWWHFTWCYLFAACLGLADWLYLKLFEQVSGRDPYYRYLFINLAMYIAEDSLGALFQFGSNLEGFSSHRITQMIQFLSSVCVYKQLMDKLGVVHTGHFQANPFLDKLLCNSSAYSNRLSYQNLFVGGSGPRQIAAVFFTSAILDCHKTWLDCAIIDMANLGYLAKVVALAIVTPKMIEHIV